jgi:hypothetical protein
MMFLAANKCHKIAENISLGLKPPEHLTGNI